MASKLKVRQIGNSLGVVLPKETLARLNVKEGDTLYLSEAPGGDLRMTPCDIEFERQMEIAREEMARYRNALRELAK